MPRARHLLILGCALGLAAGLAPSSALADGDPPSDVLISQDAYYPYAPDVVAKDLQTALNRMLKQAKAQGFELKVAIVAAAADLGSVPQLLTEPQRYADLLTTELSFNAKPRVLVVLAAGLGGNNLGDGAGPALTGVNIPAQATADDLARAAMAAVGKLTAANGTPVPVPSGLSSGGGGGGGGTSPLLVFGLPVLLVALAALLAARRGRRDDEEDERAEGDEPDRHERPSQ